MNYGKVKDNSISEGSWIISKANVSDPSVYAMYALRVERIDIRNGIVYARNPLDDSEFVMALQDAIPVEGIDEDEFLVLQALKTATSDVYEPVISYINKLRAELGKKELGFPFIRLGDYRG